MKSSGGIGVDCMSGHPSLSYTVLGGNYFTRSEDLAEKLKLAGHSVEKKGEHWSIRANPSVKIEVKQADGGCMTVLVFAGMLLVSAVTLVVVAYFKW